MLIRHSTRPTDAERIDRAVSSVLDGEPAAVPPTLATELAMAQALRDDLHPVPPGSAFEASLARRLEAAATRAADRRLLGFVRHHQRLVLTGAVGSVVVSTAGMAVVAWRHVHRSP